MMMMMMMMMMDAVTDVDSGCWQSSGECIERRGRCEGQQGMSDVG